MFDEKQENLNEDPDYVWSGCDCGDEHECDLAE